MLNALQHTISATLQNTGTNDDTLQQHYGWQAQFVQLAAVLQQFITATYYSCNTLQYTAEDCNTLQLQLCDLLQAQWMVRATHCNTLQPLNSASPATYGCADTLQHFNTLHSCNTP